jgi:DNA-binding protein H-NS
MPRRASLKVIERRIRELEAQAKAIKQRVNNPALPKIVRLMRKNGISIGELRRAIGGRGASGNGRRGRASPLRGKKVKPLYKNPKTGETWSGRGRLARWLAAAEKAGRDRADFLIKK